MFKSQAFAQVVAEYLGTSVEGLTAEQVAGVRSLRVASHPSSVLEVPWAFTSDAFNMVFPVFTFTPDYRDTVWAEDLALFTSLTHLYLASEGLMVNTLPLAPCSKLRELYVTGFHLSSWDFLQHLPSLTKLSVADANFSDLTVIGLLAQKQLEGFNRLPSSTTVIDRARFPLLSNLRVVNCGVEDLTPLKGLEYLTELDGSHNPISDLLPLQHLTQLLYLTIRYGQINSLEPLRDLQHLMGLNVRHNGVKDLSPVERLNLRDLYVAHNPIESLGLCKARRYTQTDLRSLSPI